MTAYQGSWYKLPLLQSPCDGGGGGGCVQIESTRFSGDLILRHLEIIADTPNFIYLAFISINV